MTEIFEDGGMEEYREAKKRCSNTEIQVVGRLFLERLTERVEEEA